MCCYFWRRFFCYSKKGPESQKGAEVKRTEEAKEVALSKATSPKEVSQSASTSNQGVEDAPVEIVKAPYPWPMKRTSWRQRKVAYGV